MVFSTAAMQGLEDSGAGVFDRLQRQIMATILGSFFLVLASRMRVSVLTRLAPVILGLTALSMLLVFIPGFGKTVSQATLIVPNGIMKQAVMVAE